MSPTQTCASLSYCVSFATFLSTHGVPFLQMPTDARAVSIVSFALYGTHTRSNRESQSSPLEPACFGPAVFHPNRSLRVGNHSILQPDDHFCWLASRVPPFPRIHNRAGSPARLVMDITDLLRAALSSDRPLRILYDCRFLLHIHPCRMPTHVRAALETRDKTSSIKVLPFTPYYWPKVVLQRESCPDQILAVPQENGTRDESWITIRWIRPLDAA